MIIIKIVTEQRRQDLSKLVFRKKNYLHQV